MRNLSSLLLAIFFLTSLTLAPVRADDWHGHDEGRHFDHHDDHGFWRGDIHHFHEYDYARWREGRWHNGFHDGRNGWWWTVGGFWYFYPAPIYPYPDPYTPPMVISEPVPVSPFGVAPSVTYYCANPTGYYPYVPQCYAPWQRVATNAVAEPAPQPQPMMAPAGSPREMDDRQLNAFGVEFQNIDIHAAHARRNLKDLAARVETFRQSLYQRSYNAMDILKDAEDLERRITDQRAKIPQPKKQTQGASDQPH